MKNKLLVVTIDVLLLVLCTLNISPLLNRAALPVEVIKSDGSLVVDHVTNPDIAGKIKAGDLIQAWDKFNPVTPEAFEFLSDMSGLGQHVSLKIARQDSVFWVSVPLGRFYPSPRHVLITILVGIIIWLLGLIMFFKGPGTLESNTLKWVLTAFAVSIMTTTGSMDRSSVLTYLMESVLYISYMTTACGFFLFSFIFPVKKNVQFKIFLKIVFISACILVASQVYYRLQSIFAYSLDSFYVFQYLFDIFHLAIILLITGSLVNFIFALKLARGQEERLKEKWLLWGVSFGAFPFLIFNVLPQIIGFSPPVGEEFTVFFFLAIPVTFSIAIVRFRILDIDFLISRTIVYGLLTLLIGSIYIAAIFITLSAIGGEQAFQDYLYIMIITMVVTLLFNPLRSKIQSIIDLYIFTARFNARKTVAEITQRLSQALSRDQAIEICINIWMRAMPNMAITFLSYNSRANQLVSKYGNIKISKISLTRVEASELCRKMIFARSGFVPQNHPKISFAKEKFLEDYQLSVAVPVNCDGDSLLGLLTIKSHFHKDRFIDAEIDLLASVAELLEQHISHLGIQENLFLQNAENERLRELNELKSFFVSSITHELKTPLSSIKLYADLLRTQKDKDSSKIKQHLDIIEGESDRLNRMIDNVLNISKIERKAMRFRFTKIDINEEIRETLKIMAYQLQQREFSLQTDIPDEKIYIRADGDAIRQVLTNLIANAIQYSFDEKSLEISAIRNDKFVTVMIADKGIGISEKDQKDIFNAFYRGSDDRIANIGGAGIGLAVVSHIIDAHNGKITLSSKLAAGTSFTIIFPVYAEQNHEKNPHN